MRVTYDSNNSGGRWWLKDEHWKSLEASGWFVEWGELQFCFSSYRPRNPATRHSPWPQDHALIAALARLRGNGGPSE